MMTSSAEISLMLALVVTAIIFAARLAKEPVKAFFKSYRNGNARISNVFVQRLVSAGPNAAHKKCPHCAESIAISALFCDACEYNFLSGTIGSRQKSLPAPAAIMGAASKPHPVEARV